jgi:hypothetical protein
VESRLAVRLAPEQPVVKLELTGFRTEGSEPGCLVMLVQGAEVGRGVATAEKFTVVAELATQQSEPFDLEIRFEGPAAANRSDDDERDLVYILTELRALHPWTTVFRLR